MDQVRRAEEEDRNLADGNGDVARAGQEVCRIDKPAKKEPTNEEFLEWIRKQRCAVCYGWEEWSMELGEGRNTACHIQTRGAWHGDVWNVIPACLRCHRRFEDSTNTERKTWIPVARKYWKMFIGEWSPIVSPIGPIPRSRMDRHA